ncbi:MAG: hypothetical protein OXG35_22765, partial [Acidobacteria bacterium]|nr:hypothetical protein [Acidobacteriota bacterium]
GGCSGGRARGPLLLPRRPGGGGVSRAGVVDGAPRKPGAPPQDAAVVIGEDFADRHTAAAACLKRIGKAGVDHSWELPKGVEVALEHVEAVLDAHPVRPGPSTGA